MNNGICYIVGAGENYGLDFVPECGDLIIAADGGFSFLQDININPDWVIGDFDSLLETPVHKNIIKLSREKDDTDMLSAVRKGIDLGYIQFHIYCGTGGRIDHTLANIQILAFLSEQNMHGFLFDKSCVITAIADESLSFESDYVGYVSVFSHSVNAKQVSITGLKYEIDNETVSNTFPIGVSNEFIGINSKITVKNGTLIVIFPRK